MGPGADAAHANHIHIDIEARGRDGRSKFCQ
ncbi:MAG: extensin family protein [Beijerinckiaceae bacterium]